MAILKGIPASPLGIVVGKIVIVENVADLRKIKSDSILVAYSTYPELVSGMVKSRAILTEEGGVTSHAAIVSRELGIPCVVGTRNLLTGVKNGEEVMVDSEKGIVSKVVRRVQSDRWRFRPFYMWYYMMFAKFLAAKELGSDFIHDIDAKIENGVLHLVKSVEDSYLERWKRMSRATPDNFWRFHFSLTREGLSELDNFSDFMNQDFSKFEKEELLKMYRQSLVRVKSMGKCIILPRYPIAILVEQELCRLLRPLFPSDYEKRVQILGTTSSVTTKGYDTASKFFKEKKELLPKIRNCLKKDDRIQFDYLIQALELGQQVREKSHQYFIGKIQPKIGELLLSINQNRDILYYLPSEILLNKKPKDIMSRKKGKFVLDRGLILREIDLILH